MMNYSIMYCWQKLKEENNHNQTLRQTLTFTFYVLTLIPFSPLKIHPFKKTLFYIDISTLISY